MYVVANLRLLPHNLDRMHNLIQELRGNVRVFARIRPFLPGDNVPEDTEPCIVPKSETSLKIVREIGSI